MDEILPTDEEFEVFRQIEFLDADALDNDQPSFASQPASRFETDPLPMEVTSRTAEPLDRIKTGKADIDLQAEDTSTSPADPSYTASREQGERPSHRLPLSHKDLDQMGDWPQRLLHVPTMTSFPWQSGNIYGDQKEPSYRAISYTWGRWRLNEDDKAKVKPVLHVEGVEWSIPRVDPSHFTSEQLRKVIDETCRMRKKELQPVDFIWLDLVCIDQRRGLSADLEVGRQAGIFRKSAGVVVWLSRSGKDEDSSSVLHNLFQMLATFEKAEELVRVASDHTRLRFIAYGLRKLLRDPWFSSLWTLQEAYLSTKAFLFSAQAKEFYPGEDGIFTLHNLARECRLLCLRLSTRSAQRQSDPEHHRIASEIETWVQRSGLQAMGKDDALLTLLSAARFRETSFDQDHIYGIMQVFEYRLGRSDPITYPEESYNRAELADQLGAALFRDRPLQSQLHVFTEPVERGKGWHLSPSSADAGNKYPLVPVASNSKRRSAVNWPYCACELSTQSVGPTVYGCFRGRICTFSTLATIWAAIDALPQDEKFYHMNICRFLPDVSEHIMDSEEYKGWVPHDIPDEPGRHQRFAKYLDTKFCNSYLVVLFLGDLAKYQQYYGLLLLHVKVGNVFYWARVGTCVWVYDDTIKELLQETRLPEYWRDTMKGHSPDWVLTEGLFG